MKCVLCGQTFQHSLRENTPKLKICVACFSKYSKQMTEFFEKTIQECVEKAKAKALHEEKQKEGE